MGFAAMDIKVDRIFKLNKEDGALKAFVNIIVNDSLVISGLKVLKGKRGLFVSMPREMSTKDQKWYERVKCLDEDLRRRIQDIVLEAYEEIGAHN